MSKEMIILTKSKKYGHLCVAGIDMKTGAWIRLVSEDKNIKYAVKQKDLVCEGENGETLNIDVLDKVIVKTKEGGSTWYHPENIILDTEYYLSYKGTVSSSSLNQYIDNTKKNLFFNTSNKISSEDLKKENNIYSLIMIKANIYIQRDKYNREKIRGRFNYNNTWYNSIVVTDLEFIRNNNDYIPKYGNGDLYFKDAKIILSLGEELNDEHYKLIAGIIV